MLTIRPSDVSEVFQALSPIGKLGDDASAGYLRAAYSAEETEAMMLFAEYGRACGAAARFDRLGNLSVEWAGDTPEFIEAGTHLDTVPRGGNFDGAAGVVAGLLAIRNIRQSGVRMKRGLRLRVWRAEESSTFNVLYAGSRGAFGILDPEMLTYRFKGQSLAEAMLSQDADPDIVVRRERTIPQSEADLISAHLELHIEQGNLLEVRGIDVGLVTSIRAPKRYRIVLRGEFDHAGATPMGVEYRRDVNLAMAYVQVALDQHCEARRAGGLDIVQTIGVINCNADFNAQHPELGSNAIPVISGFGYFSFETRSSSAETLEKYSREAEQLISEVSSRFGVTAEIQLLSSAKPLERMDPEIQAIMMECAQALGISMLEMPSGAGHDAAVVGAQKKSDGSTIPVGMLFIPCRKGKSHCPEEFASDEAIARGATVLANGMLALANRD